VAAAPLLICCLFIFIIQLFLLLFVFILFTAGTVLAAARGLALDGRTLAAGLCSSSVDTVQDTSDRSTNGKTSSQWGSAGMRARTVGI
jgi:hypothetical protein